MARWFQRRPGTVSSPPPPASPGDTYDAAEASYQRLMALASDLRLSAAALTAAAGRLDMRARQLSRSAAQHEEFAKTAIAGGRTIQAESSLASQETALAALAALRPEYDEVATEKAAVDAAVTRIEGEAAALRTRLDAARTQQAVSGARAHLSTLHLRAGHERAALDELVRAAEEQALRLEARARALAELHAAVPDKTGQGLPEGSGP